MWNKVDLLRKGGIQMADLTHLFKAGQIVRCRLDGDTYTGTVKETYTDHIIVDIPDVSDHCWFESGFKIGDVQPVYDFCSGELENNYE